MLQPAYHGYGHPAKEEGTPGEAGPKTRPVLQTNQSKEYGARGDHQITSLKEGPRPRLDPRHTKGRWPQCRETLQNTPMLGKYGDKPGRPIPTD